MKLSGGTAADTAGVGSNRAEVQIHACENPAVNLMHLIIGLLQACLVNMEGVGVLHNKFPGAHDAKAGPDLIPKLGLYLVEADRQLFVAL